MISLHYCSHKIFVLCILHEASTLYIYIDLLFLQINTSARIYLSSKRVFSPCVKCKDVRPFQNDGPALLTSLVNFFLRQGVGSPLVLVSSSVSGIHISKLESNTHNLSFLVSGSPFLIVSSCFLLAHQKYLTVFKMVLSAS